MTLLPIPFVWNVNAQDQVARQYGDQISEESLRENLTILASDALEGRETGKRGQKMAAAFIKAYFEELGLSGPVNGDYLQPVNLYTSKPSDIYVKVGGSKLENYKDFIYYGSSATEGEVAVPVVFAGQGRKEDFEQLDVEGKAVVVFVKNAEHYRAPIAIAREKKAKLVFLYSDKVEAFNQLMEQFKSYTGNGVLSLNKPEGKPGTGIFFTAPGVAPKLLGISAEKLAKAADADAKKKPLAKLKPSTVQYKLGMDVSVLRTDNVLGYLEGTDKKDELIVVTAHYDHIGMKGTGEDKINNGADDDGSGTVSVLELARVFAKAKKEGKGPRRSILFMTVTGEEKGLLGSDYYTQNPIFPLDKTIVDLNIDMVGRRDPQHKDSAPYVYVIGSDKLSSQLHALSESVNKATTNLIFDYTYNDQNHPERLYYRSDHWNFAKNNIPIIFYFDGIHEDYHQPSDEVEKIEFDLLKKRAQVVFFTAWEIANREEKIAADQQPK
jgi:Peptidase family M28